MFMILVDTFGWKLESVYVEHVSRCDLGVRRKLNFKTDREGKVIVTVDSCT